jgi:hypothetical protein
MRLKTFLTTTRNLFSSFPFNSCLNVTIKCGWSNEQFKKCSQNPGKLKIRTRINKRWNKINTVDFIKRYLCGISTDYPNFFFLFVPQKPFGSQNWITFELSRRETFFFSVATFWCNQIYSQGNSQQSLWHPDIGPPWDSLYKSIGMERKIIRNQNEHQIQLLTFFSVLLLNVDEFFCWSECFAFTHFIYITACVRLHA